MKKTSFLREEYNRIKENHKKAIRTRLARITIGSSVGRVLQKGSKNKIWHILEQIPVDKILQLRSQQDYKQWFETQLNILSEKIDETNKQNTRIYPGYKWGHATKILCLYLHDIVIHREYFSQDDAERVKNWLYCPIDSVVMDALERCNVTLEFKKIKEIDTEEKFYRVQDMLGQAAEQERVPRIWFDDNWSNRQG